MATKAYDQGFLQDVRDVVGEDVLAICDFSPGPSWGFNGIQTLVLTERNLAVFQRGVALTARRSAKRTAQTTIPLAAIHSVKTQRRPALLGVGGALTLRLATAHGGKTFTTKYVDQGQDFLQNLSVRVG